jgi:hypothetical protein
MAQQSLRTCSAENVTIHAYRDIGGIAGAAHGTVTGNSVKKHHFDSG